jgi:hypothetical protein
MRTFQKNRKFWMATILLVCMVTFVLCTGFQGGDFGDWLMRLIGRRGGDEVTSIDGRTITTRDLEELKAQREIANDYMRKATDLVIREVKLRSEEAGKGKMDKARTDMLRRTAALQRLLADKLARPRYFSGGTKLDDLLDFIIWRNQADRLGVRLTDDAVRDLVADELYSSHPELQRITRWGPEAATYVQREVRGSFYQANYRLIVQALTDEFRVRLARRALEQSPMPVFEPVAANKATTPGEFFEAAPETRMPVTLEQMYDYYRKNRNAATVALIPVRVENPDVLAKIPAPTEADLKVLFDKHRTRKFNPAEEEPGFQQPEQVQVRWVTADAKSKFYTQAARTLTTLQAFPPVLYNPVQPLPVAAASYAAHSADWEARLLKTYQLMRFRNPEKYEIGGLATPYFALPLYQGMLKPKAETAAGLLAASAAPANGYAAFASYQAAAYIPQARELEPLLQHERDRRWPVGSTMVLSGAASPFLALGMQYAAAEVPQFLRDGKQYQAGDYRTAPPYRRPGFTEDYAGQPLYLPLLGPVRKEMRTVIENNLAIGWARDTMREVRSRLDAKAGGPALTSELNKLGRQLGKAITVGGTEDYRSPYNIADDAGMAPLKASYDKYFERVNIEGGLSGTAGVLGPDDFNQLFFGGQPFAVGNTALFTPRPWPPTLTRQLNQLEALLQGRGPQQKTVNLWDDPDVQPFLFWRTGTRPSAPPEQLAEVRRDVEHAWKVGKARDAILPRLKEVTDALVKVEKEPHPDLWAAVRQQAQKQGEERALMLQNIAPLVEEQKPAGDISLKQMITVYVPYELPRGTIHYPRPDTAKNLLALRELKEPLKTGDKALDELNKSLFEQTKASGNFIQVMTNQPRTVYYVAVLMRPPTAVDPNVVDTRFLYALQHGISAFQPVPNDLFVQQCQNAFARDYRRELMAQLRQEAKMTAPSADAKKRFDTEGGQ